MGLAVRIDGFVSRPRLLRRPRNSLDAASSRTAAQRAPGPAPGWAVGRYSALTAAVNEASPSLAWAKSMPVLGFV